MSKRVGFIGLGNMGKPMSLNVLKNGFDLTVHDIRPEPVKALEAMGAKTALNPAELSSQVDVIITILPGPTEIREVILGENGVIKGLRSDSILIDMSTSSPALTKKIASRLSQKGSKMLDAPVSLSTAGAEAKGALTIMVGGDAEVLDECRNILQAMATQIVHVGTNGMGHAMKLVNQMIIHTGLVSICEAFAVGVQAGLDPRIIFEVVSRASGNSFIFQYKAPRILSGNFDPGSTVDILYKDLNVATEFSKELGVPLTLSNVALEVYKAARALGLSNKDGTSIIKLFEQYIERKIVAQDLKDENSPALF